MADDDWDCDDNTSALPVSNNLSSNKGGVTFGRGRGFKPANSGGRSRQGENGFNDRGDGERRFKPNNDRGDGERRFRPSNDDDGEKRNDRRNGDGEEGAEGEAKPPPVSYVPPEPTEDEEEIYGNGISSGINFAKYDAIPTTVTGRGTIPSAINTFAESGLRKLILEQVAKCDYKVPTPIQKRAIPIIMAGRDVMGCAQTGSGKTAAFLLPMIHSLLADPQPTVVDENGAQPQVIIVAPTRELAVQIYNEARKFTKGSAIYCCIAYGGVQVAYQLRQIRNGCNILVATPGRLIDFVERSNISFASIRFAVLDEADRMLDMGFQSSIEKMFNHPTMVPKADRQTLMFSATFPDEIQRLAGKFLNDYLFITVGVVGGACSDVEQRILPVKRTEKKGKLSSILREQGAEKTVIFVQTKKNADFLAVYLSENEFSATSIHGDREQCQREEALRDFRSGRRPVLVATAVASRGLDIKGVAHVINYDMPKEIDEYVHRIGRTGRLGNKGLSTSFFDEDNDSALASALVRVLSQAQQEVPEFLQDLSSGGFSSGGNGFGGTDYRKDSGAPAEVVEDEDWD